MSRVIFDNSPTTPAFNPIRADIACFVGLVRVLSGATVPATVAAWLRSLGFSSGPAPNPNQIATLTNIPIPVNSYGEFTALFDDGSTGSGFGTDYLATGVHSFFAQGGRKCYIVRVNDPVTPYDTPITMATKLLQLLPNSTFAPDQSQSWTGVGSLSALEDASFLLTPDLPVLSASTPSGAAGQMPNPATGPEEFVVCSLGSYNTPLNHAAPPAGAAAPRLAATDYANWAASVAVILNYLSSGVLTHQLNLREVQYVAAFPMPQDLDPATAAENPDSDEIAQDIQDVIDAQMPETVIPTTGGVPQGNISSSFLQLAYPWLKTSGSGILLESLEAPDGALAGLLARNALTRGTFTSATKIMPAEIYDVSPTIPPQETISSAQPLIWGAHPPQTKALIERLSLFGFTPSGLQLLSDVTAYPGESYRSAPVNRLVNVICRAARQMGESAVFQNNGPALWGRVQRFLQNLMTRLWTLNALDGDTASDSFSVRCDRTTMTQNDLDNGRLIAYLTFTPASTIETITVQLAMETSGTSAQQITANLAEAS
jgi:uncharacterized protein